jgi:hypothetical protein
MATKSNGTGRPVAALCEWFWRRPGGYEWVSDEDIDGPRFKGVYSAVPVRCDQACRASLGARIVTVWLPQGACIRLRLPRAGSRDPMAENWVYRYGRERDRAIRIRLTELPTNEAAKGE